MSRTTLIVDGYNVIRQAGGPYDRLYESDPDAARTRLVSDVAGYAAGEWRATVVFDGGGNPSSDGTPHEIAGVDVIFSAYGTDADSVVERLVADARDAREEVVVVSSDAQTQWSVMGGGVTRMSSRAFIGEMLGVQDEHTEANPSGSVRGTISDRIDSNVREQLIRWSRGGRG